MIYDMVWYDMIYMVWYIWYDMWYDMVWYDIWYDMIYGMVWYGMIYIIYLLTAIGLPTGGSSTIHVYTQTTHRTTQNKQYIEQHKNLGEW